MIPALATAYVNRPDLLNRMLSSVDAPCEHLLVVNNSGKPLPQTRPIEELSLGVNLGCAGAWNMILDRAFNQLNLPWVLICGSDIEWQPGDLNTFEKTVNDFPEASFLNGPLAFNHFVICRACWEKIGAFWEESYPAFLEDSDYWQRIRRCAIKVAGAEGLWTKHEGSASLKAGDEEFRSFVRQRHQRTWSKYAAKWGCPEWSSGLETFATPFNEGGPINAWKLSPERMNEPHYYTENPIVTC